MENSDAQSNKVVEGKNGTSLSIFTNIGLFFHSQIV